MRTYTIFLLHFSSLNKKVIIKYEMSSHPFLMIKTVNWRYFSRDELCALNMWGVSKNFKTYFYQKKEKENTTILSKIQNISLVNFQVNVKSYA